MRAKEFIINLFEGKQKGTFAGVRFSPKTKKAIAKYCKDNDIPNATPQAELHCTLLYSKKHLPDYTAQGKIDPMYKGEPGKLAIWGDADEAALVLQFKCPELSKRHKELMKEHDAKWDYPSYKPHVTLSYQAESVKVKDLPAFTGTIEIVNEYSTALATGWAEDLTEGVDRIPFPEVIERFKKERADKIKIGCHRGKCHVTTGNFKMFAKQHGHTVKSIDGFFKIDNPEYDYYDFYDDEVLQMKAEGMNPESYADRKAFALKHNMVDELTKVPHHWSEYKGKIIDFTGSAQFVRTGLAADTSKKRYSRK